MQMNFPGSLIGACSRAEVAGTVTGSLIDATASALAGPPSMNPRADAGRSAAAISWARTAPRAARVAATLAGGATLRAACREPGRGGWPVVENRPRFMDERLPTEMYRDYSLFREERPAHFPSEGPGP